MQTKPQITLSSSESSLEFNFTEMFKIENLLIGLLISISNFFKNGHLLAYCFVLVGLFTTAVLAPIVSRHPDTFGGWEYVIQTVSAFPMLYFSLFKFLPFFIQMIKDDPEEIVFPQKFEEDNALIFIILSICYLFLFALGILSYLFWQLALVPWFVWLLIQMFKEHRIRR